MLFDPCVQGALISSAYSKGVRLLCWLDACLAQELCQWLLAAVSKQVCNKRAVPAGKCRRRLAYGWRCSQAFASPGLSLATQPFLACSKCAQLSWPNPTAVTWCFMFLYKGFIDNTTTHKASGLMLIQQHKHWSISKWGSKEMVYTEK